MTTPPSFSNFLSNFANSIPTCDILSTIGTATTYQTQNSGSTTPSSGSYFYIGNILIQFSNEIMTDRPSGQTYNQTFPIVFGGAQYPPYVVLITGTSDSGSNTVTATITAGTTYESFNFRIGTSEGNMMYIAIGPA